MAFKQYILLSSPPTYRRPSTIAGADPTALPVPVWNCHNGPKPDADALVTAVVSAWVWLSAPPNMGHSSPDWSLLPGLSEGRGMTVVIGNVATGRPAGPGVLGNGRENGHERDQSENHGGTRRQACVAGVRGHV